MSPILTYKCSFIISMPVKWVFVERNWMLRYIDSAGYKLFIKHLMSDIIDDEDASVRIIFGREFDV